MFGTKKLLEQKWFHQFNDFRFDGLSVCKTNNALYWLECEMVRLLLILTLGIITN